jgi:hypothetical protein
MDSTEHPDRALQARIHPVAVICGPSALPLAVSAGLLTGLPRTALDGRVRRRDRAPGDQGGSDPWIGLDKLQQPGRLPADRTRPLQSSPLAQRPSPTMPPLAADYTIKGELSCGMPQKGGASGVAGAVAGRTGAQPGRAWCAEDQPWIRPGSRRMAGAIRRARWWAGSLMPLAVLWAGFGLVIAGAARMRVGATMLPGLPLQSLHDLKGLAGLVQPRPFQPCVRSSTSNTRFRSSSTLLVIPNAPTGTPLSGW